MRTAILVRWGWGGGGARSGYIKGVLVSRLLEIYSTCLRLESIEREREREREENFG